MTHYTVSLSRNKRKTIFQSAWLLRGIGFSFFQKYVWPLLTHCRGYPVEGFASCLASFFRAQLWGFGIPWWHSVSCFFWGYKVAAVHMRRLFFKQIRLFYVYQFGQVFEPKAGTFACAFTEIVRVYYLVWLPKMPAHYPHWVLNADSWYLAIPNLQKKIDCLGLPSVCFFPLKMPCAGYA